MSESLLIAIIGLLSVVMGQTLVQLLNKFLGRAKEKSDQNLGLREELRTEIARLMQELAELRAENRMLDSDRDKWRIDYFKLYQAFFELKALAVGLLHRTGATNIELPDAPRRERDSDV